MTVTIIEPDTVKLPRHRGERDTQRDTLDWFNKALAGRVPNGKGQHRLNPYAGFRYQVTEATK